MGELTAEDGYSSPEPPANTGFRGKFVLRSNRLGIAGLLPKRLPLVKASIGFS